MKKFIEYLEELADLKQNCTVRFKGDNSGIAVIQTRLTEVNMEGEGYITTGNGLRIDISQLIEVNGRLAQNIC